MGMDPPPRDVMRRPPRRLTDRVIDREMWYGVVFVGLVMAIATLLATDAVLPGGLISGAGGLTEARTVGFTVLVLAQLFNCFNSRSERDSAFHGLFRNPLLWGAIGVSIALQVLVVQTPFLNRAFSTTPLSGTEWATCAAIASSVLWADEVKKFLVRRVAARRTARAAD
jgi:Ca2+-transporting ATPase